MKALMLGALAAALLPATAQAGENWREMTTVDGIVFAIDLDSIKTVGKLRHFRVRTTKPGATLVGYYDNAADCAALTVDTLYGEASNNGVILRKQLFKPGEMRNRLDDDQGKLIYSLVCGG